MILKLGVHQNHVEDFCKYKFLGLFPLVSDLVPLEYSLLVCISNKLSGNADVTGRSTVCEKWRGHVVERCLGL